VPQEEAEQQDQDPAAPAATPITQEGDQESESGEIYQDFEVS
jgi:hypothetical protein